MATTTKAKKTAAQSPAEESQATATLEPPEFDRAAAEARIAELDEQIREFKFFASPEEVKQEAELRAKRDLLAQSLEAYDVTSLPMAGEFTPTIDAIVDDIPIAEIARTGNHRLGDDEAEIARLARSIEELGLQSPIGVREIEGGYELIYGSRRLRAHQLLKRDTIAAQVYPEKTTNEEVELRRTVENLHRREISPAEQAIAIARLVEQVSNGSGEQLYRATKAGGIHAYVGQLLGRTAKWVSDHAYVTRLGGRAKTFLAEGRIDLGHARLLAMLGDPERADDFAYDCARSEDGTGGRNVDWLKRIIDGELANLGRAPWTPDAEFPEHAKTEYPSGPCASCKFNSQQDPLLFGEFDDGKGKGTCGFKACFSSRLTITQKKMDAAVTKALKAGRSADAADFVPLTVKESTFVRAVKKAEETGGTPARKSAGQSAPVETAEQKAKRLHEDKVQAWKDRCKKVIASRIKETPGAATWWMLVHNKLNPTAHDQPSEARARKFLASPAAKALLKPMAKPTLADFASQDKDNPFDPWVRNWVPEAIELMAEVFGVELEPMPQLGQADAPKAAAKAKKGKGAK